MEHVMIDLETVGKRAGCGILSIGAVAFDPLHGLGPEMYCVVNRSNCAEFGLHEDPETVTWWEGRDKDAKVVLQHAEEGGLMLPEALGKLTEYLAQFDLKKVKVWGNGSDFDNAILNACYVAVGEKLPWEFWNNRCYRTLKSLKPQVKMARLGTYHNALDDARSQARHAIEIFRVLAGITSTCKDEAEDIFSQSHGGDNV